MPDIFTTVHRERIIGLAAQYGLPAIYPYRFFTAGGGLMSYGIDPNDLYRRSGSYVARILKAEKPVDLPVQLPTKFGSGYNCVPPCHIGEINLRDRTVADETSSLPYRKITGPLRALQEAASLHSQGRFREAEQRYQIVLDADDRNIDALYRLGLIRLQQGRFGDAAKLFRRAIKVDRRSADAHHHLAVALSGLGRHDEAIERYHKALAIKPDLAEAHNNLAHSFQNCGQMEQALAHYKTALALKPDYSEARNNLGVVLQALGRSAEAIAQYEMALAVRPNYADAHKNLGNLLGAASRYQQAAAHYEQALSVRPNDAETHAALGNILRWLDRPDEAIAHYARALSFNPAYIEAHNGLGLALHMLGRSEEAIQHYRRALGIDPTDLEAHSRLGEALQALGRLEESRLAFEQAVVLAPRKAGCYWNLANSQRFTEDDLHLANMKELLRDEASLTVEERIDLHFALGKALADAGDREQSFHHLLRGNSLMRRQTDYDEAAALGRLDRIRNTFTAALMREKRGHGDPSATPVFIVGMPRSGTTLIEQIIASHPTVFGGGELRVMANLAETLIDPNGALFPEAVPAMSGEHLRRLGGEYLRAVRRLSPDAERITDKMPGNLALAGLIHLALPNARIIHVCRDPRDTAFSCFSILFARGHEFSYDLSELGRYFRAYQGLVDHWRDVMPETMLEVHYEEVVADLEPQARRIIAHCGLEWDDACLAFHRNARPVRTASATQVRQPVYRSSIGRWRPYEDALQPLLQPLG
jgi:tetratricopeptide (TPR) repeat protein